MGRTAYRKAPGGGIPSSVLGDASRGALYLALRPAASNGESPSPPPPERRAQPASRSFAALALAGEPLVPPRAPSLTASAWFARVTSRRLTRRFRWSLSL